MSEKKSAAPCGNCCGSCEFFGEKCSGCCKASGQPFWANQLPIDICPIYSCCTYKKKLEHCGECDELPCEIFLKFRDPSLSEEDAEILVKVRQNDLRMRKRLGTVKWLELKKKSSTEAKDDKGC
jgi:hypothetical protein